MHRRRRFVTSAGEQRSGRRRGAGPWTHRPALRPRRLVPAGAAVRRFSNTATDTPRATASVRASSSAARSSSTRASRRTFAPSSRNVGVARLAAMAVSPRTTSSSTSVWPRRRVPAPDTRGRVGSGDGGDGGGEIGDLTHCMEPSMAAATMGSVGSRDRPAQLHSRRVAAISRGRVASRRRASARTERVARALPARGGFRILRGLSRRCSSAGRAVAS